MEVVGQATRNVPFSTEPDDRHYVIHMRRDFLCSSGDECVSSVNFSANLVSTESTTITAFAFFRPLIASS